jgi:hypothetical protein
MREITERHRRADRNGSGRTQDTRTLARLRSRVESMEQSARRLREASSALLAPSHSGGMLFRVARESVFRLVPQVRRVFASLYEFNAEVVNAYEIQLQTIREIEADLTRLLDAREQESADEGD